jgi:CheY-like chemotaxis protein
VVGRTSGKPSIQITRRIERPDGSFAGVGVVSLDPAYLNQFFASIDPGPNSVISLIGRDGVLRARSSRAGSTLGIGHDFSDASFMPTILSAAQGNYRWRSPLDGIERIYGFSADSQYPVIVKAAMAIDDIGAARRSADMVQSAVGVALTVVKDSGTGMPPEVAAKAFDPFFTTKEQGTGLGLSQVYGFAKQLGGTATIDTLEQAGTTVTLYLPAMPTAQALKQFPTRAIAEAPMRPEAARSGAPTVLVADDNEQVREFIASAISDADYEIIEADNGLSALDVIGRYPVHLAVLDVSMPGMSGIDVYARARGSGWEGAVLFVSGFADPANVARMGGKPFLAKPFGAQTLRDQVAQILAETTKPSLVSQL